MDMDVLEHEADKMSLDEGSDDDDDSSIDDATDDEDTPAPSKNLKNRNRRASEGSHLIKGESKKSAADLRCDTCGKGYKHSSCLTKHLYVFLDVFSIPILMRRLLDGSMIRPGQLLLNC